MLVWVLVYRAPRKVESAVPALREELRRAGTKPLTTAQLDALVRNRFNARRAFEADLSDPRPREVQHVAAAVEADALIALTPKRLAAAMKALANVPIAVVILDPS